MKVEKRKVYARDAEINLSLPSSRSVFLCLSQLWKFNIGPKSHGVFTDIMNSNSSRKWLLYCCIIILGCRKFSAKYHQPKSKPKQLKFCPVRTLLTIGHFWWSDTCSVLGHDNRDLGHCKIRPIFKTVSSVDKEWIEEDKTDKQSLVRIIISNLQVL